MTITIDQQDWRKVLAEVIGTFFFFFIGMLCSPPWERRTGRLLDHEPAQPRMTGCGRTPPTDKTLHKQRPLAASSPLAARGLR